MNYYAGPKNREEKQLKNAISAPSRFSFPRITTLIQEVKFIPIVQFLKSTRIFQNLFSAWFLLIENASLTTYYLLREILVEKETYLTSPASAVSVSQFLPLSPAQLLPLSFLEIKFLKYLQVFPSSRF